MSNAESNNRQKTLMTPDNKPALGAWLEDFFQSSAILRLGQGDDEDNAPLSACFQMSPQGENCPVTLVLGENASGKSFVLRLLAMNLSTTYERAEALQVSMRYRTRGGMHQSFMYGPFGDGQNSTGATSMVAVGGAFRTAKNRTTPTLVVLDEADTGLSESYGYAFGALAAGHAVEGLGDYCLGLAMVTHSREAVRGLVERLGYTPHVAYLGGTTFDLGQWLDGPLVRYSIEQLEGLNRASIDQYRAIDRFVAARTKANGT